MNQVLKQGSSGYLVEILQLKLGVTCNGIFDSSLKKAIEIFQKNNNLLEDGIVGYMTWNALDLNPEEICKTERGIDTCRIALTTATSPPA